MLQNTVQARLVLRNDSSENWAEKNPVLLAGEPGYSLDQKVLKIGDGTTPWNSLPMISGEGGGGGSGGLIPVATKSTIGGVLSSEKDNNIKVEENGVMTLNRVSSSLLYVPEEDELILDGGKS